MTDQKILAKLYFGINSIQNSLARNLLTQESVTRYKSQAY